MSTHRIPLFPLNVVLFPGMPLPLHIFEPRYQLMIRRCLDEERAFGVCLIREGEEVGGPAVPHEIGTTCEILATVPLEDGRMNLMTAGRERFRAVRLHQDQPYLEAEVEYLRETPGPLDDLPERVRAATSEYLRLVLPGSDPDAEPLELPDDPAQLSYLVGALLSIPLPSRQELLEYEVLSDRLARELELIREQIAEHSEEQHVLRVRPFQPKSGMFSQN